MLVQEVGLRDGVGDELANRPVMKKSMLIEEIPQNWIAALCQCKRGHVEVNQVEVNQVITDRFV